MGLFLAIWALTIFIGTAIAPVALIVIFVVAHKYNLR